MASWTEGEKMCATTLENRILFTSACRVIIAIKQYNNKDIRSLSIYRLLVHRDNQDTIKIVYERKQ